MIREDEIVTEIDMSLPEEERKKQEQANLEAKLRHAARREQEWLDQPSLSEKFMNGISKIKALFARKKNKNLQAQQQADQKQR